MKIYMSLILLFPVLYYSSRQDSTVTKTAMKDSIKADTLMQQEPKDTPPPKITDIPFKTGETLTFKLRYGFIRAGTAIMKVMGETTVRGNPVYHIRTTAESAAGFSWIYKVDDVIDSYMDKYRLFSWKFDKRLREGSYKIDLLIDYNPLDTLAKVEYTKYDRRMRIDEKSKYNVVAPPYAFDVLAAFYYTRTQKLEPGKSISIVNHDHKKVYNLLVKVHGLDTLETDAGTFRCLVVEPLLRGEGIFQQKGRLVVWLTDDELKIPVQMQSEIAVGSITAELEEFSGINQVIPAMLARNE
jgi:hypothetical protein